MADLVRSTLRLRPDRISVGEVRGGEALDMLKAWNTGHPGGIATVHANSARSALYRIEQLVSENVVTVPRRLIAEAIDLVVFISGRGIGRKVESVAEVTGLAADGDYAVTDLAIPHRTGDCICTPLIRPRLRACTSGSLLPQRLHSCCRSRPLPPAARK